MKQGNPACKVMGGVASGPNHLTRELMDAGILPLVDLFNLHIYPGARAPEGYLAETGFAAPPDGRARRPQADLDHGVLLLRHLRSAAQALPAGRRRMVRRAAPGERARVRRVHRALPGDHALRGVEKVFIHSGASGAVNDPNYECCLFAMAVRPDSSPGAGGLHDLVGPHPRFAGEKAIGEEGHSLAFETANRSVVVAWDPSGASPPLRAALPRSAAWTLWAGSLPRGIFSLARRRSTWSDRRAARGGCWKGWNSRSARKDPSHASAKHAPEEVVQAAAPLRGIVDVVVDVPDMRDLLLFRVGMHYIGRTASTQTSIRCIHGSRGVYFLDSTSGSPTHTH